MTKRTCSIDGCQRPHTAKGYCKIHYYQSRRYGSPYVTAARAVQNQPIEVRLAAKYAVDLRTGCWIWTAATNQRYGVVSYEGRQRYAHRVSWELVNGPIPVGLTLDHLCRTPLCINPRHLEPVTYRENTLRGRAPAILQHLTGYCGKGHEMVAENIYHYPNGGRVCRRCHAEYEARRRAALPKLPRDPARQVRGERQGSAKLTEALVLEARQRASAGETQLAIAESMGVNQTTISKAIRGEHWQHVHSTLGLKPPKGNT